MRQAVTVSLPEELLRKLDQASNADGSTRSDVVRRALHRFFTEREFNALRRRLVPRAEAQGIVTDEDVCDAIS